MEAKIRLRNNLLKDVKAGFSFGKPDASTPQTPPADPPASGTGPEDVRAGAIGGAHYYEVRNIIQVPFDDSIDSTHDLECFFQMPTNVVKISKAQVWVQKKPFRMYSSAASSSSSGAGGAHTHDIGSAGTAGSGLAGTGATTTENGHTHLDGDGVTTTGTGTGHWHNGPSHQHTYNVQNGTTNFDFPTHSHSISTSTTLAPGIFESGGTGNLTLYLADNGVAYGAAIVSGSASDISAQDLLSQLTKGAGDKRIKVHGDALMRVQVLLVLDLLVSVDPLSIGIV